MHTSHLTVFLYYVGFKLVCVNSRPKTNENKKKTNRMMGEVKDERRYDSTFAGLEFVNNLRHGPAHSSWRRLCSTVSCRPGRECVEGVCQCMKKCPDHWRPVCGSDGVTYDNHCELHRTACSTAEHISPVRSGFCSGDRETILARQEFIQQLSLWDQPQSLQVPLPDACFQNDRDRLREFLMDWFEISAKQQPWYIHGMSRGEELLGHFEQIIQKDDQALDSKELNNYLAKKKTSNMGESVKKRQLCLDALVEEGDTNGDWRLSFTEFTRILRHEYLPTRKVCSLEGQQYKDEAETTMECNGCVCACGKWVCTSKICPEGYQDLFEDSEEDDKEYSEEEDSEEDPEDDMDVQDIRWF